MAEFPCAHCGRVSDRLEAMVNDRWVCHPDTGMDCYRLVTVWHEPIGARLPGAPFDGAPMPIPLNDWSN